MAVSGSDKAKIIIVGAILLVAVGWIAYYVIPRGPNRGMSRSDAEKAAADAVIEQKKIEEEAAKAPPAIKRLEKAGS